MHCISHLCISNSFVLDLLYSDDVTRVSDRFKGVGRTSEGVGPTLEYISGTHNQNSLRYIL